MRTSILSSLFIVYRSLFDFPNAARLILRPLVSDLYEFEGAYFFCSVGRYLRQRGGQVATCLTEETLHRYPSKSCCCDTRLYDFAATFATIEISTSSAARAMWACTHARAGACPSGTHAFQTSFINAK